MTPAQLKPNDIVTSDRASILLSSLPIKDEKFALIKREFFDAVLSRYGWELKHLTHDLSAKLTVIMNFDLILASVVFDKDCKGHLLIKGFLLLCSKLSEPITSNNNENIGKPKKIK